MSIKTEGNLVELLLKLDMANLPQKAKDLTPKLVAEHRISYAVDNYIVIQPIQSSSGEQRYSIYTWCEF